MICQRLNEEYQRGLRETELSDLEPDPVPIWRSPLARLRAGFTGLVILSPVPADSARILANCRGGIETEDRVPRSGVRAAMVSRSPAGLAGLCQAATAGSLMKGSSLKGAMVSSVM
jgi:hypothetical protein